MNNENFFGKPIYTYTRAQAIADGVLIDLSEVPSVKIDWKVPLACTSTVWAIIEKASKVESKDISKVCSEIALLARLQFAFHPDDVAGVIFHFNVGLEMHMLKLLISGGDKGEPVLTLMLEHED